MHDPIRLASLEREVRMLRRLLICVLLAAVATLTAMMQGSGVNSPSEIIRARRMEVVDDRGTTLVRLDGSEHGGRVQVFGSSGHATTAVANVMSHGTLTLRSQSGATLAAVGAESNGDGRLVLFSRDGMNVVTVRESKLAEGIEASVETAKKEIGVLEMAVKLFMISNGMRMPTIDELVKKDEKGQRWLEMDFEGDFPADPWGSAYVLVDLEGREFDVVSWGPDRVEGTVDDISLRSVRSRKK